MIESIDKAKKLDKAVFVICAAVFLIAVYSVIKGELAMFLPK